MFAVSLTEYFPHMEKDVQRVESNGKQYGTLFHQGSSEYKLHDYPDQYITQSFVPIQRPYHLNII